MIVMECERYAKLRDWLRATSFGLRAGNRARNFASVRQTRGIVCSKLAARSSQPDLPPEVLRIPLGILFPLFRKVVEREDGRDRTNRNAGAAIDAFYRVDIQHLLGPELLGVLLGMNAIHRTRVNTGCVFRSDAGLGNYVGHRISCSSQGG